MPGFSEMDKHFSDFNKPVKQNNAVIEGIRDNFDAIGGLVSDIGYDIFEPIYYKRLDSRIEKDTKKFESLCQYAKMTGNQLWVYHSNKYEDKACSAELITDGETHLLVERSVLKAWMIQGIVVINGVGVEASYDVRDGGSIVTNYKKLKKHCNWIIRPVEFPKNRCSNLKAVNRMMKQYLKSIK